MPVKLLVANRGEIARRIIRTCRSLGISTVAVYSTPDRDAPFVAEADEAVPLGGAAPAGTYLAAGAMIDAARLTGAEALHPGYGFLAENAAFAAAVDAAGLTWIGPGPSAIESMGDKIGAIRHVADLGIPVLPHALVGEADAAAAAARVGFPLLVKAARGGGGTGMRLVAGPEDVARALSAAGREAASSFGDGTLYLEQSVERPRHIEVQVFGDRGGRVIHLWERDCSLQRRHQKVVEEAPAPGLDPGLRERLLDAAVLTAGSVGYVGAGTVEFLVAGSDYWFLEMNTRLQVEHPVTEEVTGIDLVRWQIEVAGGGGLPSQANVPEPRGHAVEARIYAEDPASGYLPQSGTITRWSAPAGVRVDSAIESGSVVAHHYDPLLAKLVAHRDTRDAAFRLLHRSLRDLEVHGIVTNRELLVALTAHPEVRAGGVDTAWLDRRGPVSIIPDPDPETLRIHATVASLARAAEDRRRAPLPELSPDWRNVPTVPVVRRLATDGREFAVGLRFGRDGLQVDVDGVAVTPVEVLRTSPAELDLMVAGVRRTYRVHLDDGRVWVDSPLGSTKFDEVARFTEAAGGDEPGSLIAPMPATVVAVHAAVGDIVAVGDPLMVLEAMKMEHTVSAPVAGRIDAVRASPGDQVPAGAVLAVITEE